MCGILSTKLIKYVSKPGLKIKKKKKHQLFCCLHVCHSHISGVCACRGASAENLLTPQRLQRTRRTISMKRCESQGSASAWQHWQQWQAQFSTRHVFYMNFADLSFFHCLRQEHLCQTHWGFESLSRHRVITPTLRATLAPPLKACQESSGAVIKLLTLI